MIVSDFSRTHVAAVIGKQVSQRFYGVPVTKSYFFGCSTAGRQGLKAAQAFPEDYDGIIAGSPAADFNNLMSWSGSLFDVVGSPGNSRYIGPTKWLAVQKETMKQCDTLDGVKDNVIEDPSKCNFEPEKILCKGNIGTPNCLTKTEIETVKKVLAPLYGVDGRLVSYPLEPAAGIKSAVLLYGGDLASKLTYAEVSQPTVYRLIEH
jgi:feruloyl esterase